MNFLGLNKNTTFKPKKNIPTTANQQHLQGFPDVTLGSEDLKRLVKLPPEEDLNEWLAVHTVDFYNQINMLYGSIAEYCTTESCPVMSAGKKYEYHWCDGVQIKKPIKVSAPQYINYLTQWIQNQIDDESVFPSVIAVPFPKDFKVVISTIFKRLFRVYAHMYFSHLDKVTNLGEEAHLNTSFKHFMYFVREYDLIEQKEQEPLREVIFRLLEKK
ncbi:MOB kinase activator 1B [Coelomomyces lativittatus]|nr:MOB kinase activator 1B [Coelomomyces lativittatus]KAJ1511528.1 MOB kinase activator 1B [Coelomomyces lativittatus]